MKNISPSSFSSWIVKKLIYMKYIKYTWNMHRTTKNIFEKYIYMGIVKFCSSIDFSTNLYNRYFPVKI